MEIHEKYGPCISVDQKVAVDAVEEVKIDKTLNAILNFTSRIGLA